MRLRRLGVAAVGAAALALAGGGGAATPVASAELNHAAIVIDTADGTVRKYCLAFPEESIDGAEALRRIESQAVFGSYAGKGQAVCKLSGVGCPADDCFCDRSKYWAYHRAAPGGAPYRFSSAGVSSTVVRDGDVEGWRWGTGDAPPAATVGEVCDVPEPPARTSASSGSAGPPPTTAPPSSTTTTPPATPAPASPPSGSPPTTVGPVPAGGVAPRPPAPGPAASPPATAGAPADPGSALPGAGAVSSGEDGAPMTTTDRAAITEEAAEEAARPQPTTGPTGSRGAAPGGVGSLAGVLGFVVVLAGVLAWRARLRRANVRR